MKTDTLLSIAANMKKFLAQELHMQEDEISEDMQFIDLGLDSITGVTWVRKINEKYKLTIEATKVYSYPTLNDFSKYVKAEAEKHGTIIDEPVETIQKPAPIAEPVAVVKKVTPVDVPVYTPKTTINKIDSLPGVKKLTSWRKQSNLKIKYSSSATSKLQPIAIIGMSGQFPQAKNLEEYWNNISEGKNCITKIPKTRWDLDKYYREGNPIPGKTNCEWQGSLEEFDLFDPLFFNIAPTEAECMDPQQRVFLQSCWHAIENAGYDAKSLYGSKCGVFVGSGIGDYQFLSRELQITAKGFTGNANSILAARISYFLNLQGPCITIDTACSSSLVAISSACESLNTKSSDLALAGGVCVMTTPDLHIKSSQTGMLSLDGRCYTFDNRANGFVPGEGVGVVILKRLDDAQRDNDRILGVIHGWGINQDGKTNGITAPSPESQRRLMQDVYDKFNIDPTDIKLVEAHGTGTKLGDPIEVAALIDAFSKYTKKKNYCAIGSVKSNIGHCLAAAGVASVIKVVLSLNKRQLPPTINFERLNEHINLKDTPFYVNDRLQNWNGNGSERFLSTVSSFGFSGTNAHLVIGEYVPTEKPKKVSNPNSKIIIPLSARNLDRLKQKVRDLLDFINKNSQIDLNEMAYTLQLGREAMDDRIGFLVGSTDQLKDKLKAFLDGETGIEGVSYGQVNRSKEGMQFINQDNEVQTTLVDKWLTSGQLSKLLGAWVKGLSFDWNRLYGTVKPQRIELPVYPFSKERYWIENEDDREGQISSESLPKIHPLLHTNTSNFKQQCYSSFFTGEELFLKDHQLRVSDDESAVQSVLPGVAYLEMARAAIENAMNVNPDNEILELQNVIWVRPVVVTDKKHVSIALMTNENHQIEFEVFSLDNNQEVVHCQGQAVLRKRQTPERIDIDSLKNKMRIGQLESKRTYSALKMMGLHYGPAHQGIEIIYQGENQALGRLLLPDVVEKNSDFRDFVLHPSLMDSALQVAVGFTEDLDQLSGQPSIPFALEKVAILSLMEKAMYSWVRYSPDNKMDGKLSKLDIDLIDKNGNVCVQMRGFTSRILEGDMKQLHQKTTNILPNADTKIKEDDSSFNVSFYEKLIKNVLNNEVSIDEAIEIE